MLILQFPIFFNDFLEIYFYFISFYFFRSKRAASTNLKNRISKEIINEVGANKVN